MKFVFRSAKTADYPRVLDLLHSALRENLTEAERAERGFIQGHFTPETVSYFHRSIGIVMALDAAHAGPDDALAGVCLLSDPRDVSYKGPAASLRDHVNWLYPDTRWAMYGPIVINAEYHSAGLLRPLLAEAATWLTRYELAAGFVDSANPKSLGVHSHLPFTDEGTYAFNGHEYETFTFVPERFRKEVLARR